MTHKPKILLVDNCREKLETQYKFLAENGYGVVTATDVQGALSQLKNEQPALTVLNLDTPILMGLDLLEEKKVRGDRMPIIVVADADLNNDLGTFVLRSGATCYINQTPCLEFLTAQINSIVTLYEGTEKMSMLIAGPLRINQRAHQVFIGEKEISLQPLQYKLLVFLMTNAQQRFTRAHLLESVWDHGYFTEGTVTRCVAGIRAKLPELRHIIRCKAGGYIFEERVQLV